MQATQLQSRLFRNLVLLFLWLTWTFYLIVGVVQINHPCNSFVENVPGFDRCPAGLKKTPTLANNNTNGRKAEYKKIPTIAPDTINGRKAEQKKIPTIAPDTTKDSKEMATLDRKKKIPTIAPDTTNGDIEKNLPNFKDKAINDKIPKCFKGIPPVVPVGIAMLCALLSFTGVGAPVAIGIGVISTAVACAMNQ